MNVISFTGSMANLLLVLLFVTCAFAVPNEKKKDSKVDTKLLGTGSGSLAGIHSLLTGGNLGNSGRPIGHIGGGHGAQIGGRPINNFGVNHGGRPGQFGSQHGGRPGQFGSQHGGRPGHFGSQHGGRPGQFGGQHGGRPGQFGSHHGGRPGQFGGHHGGQTGSFGGRPGGRPGHVGGQHGGSSSSCRYWCKNPSNQFYCCENDNQTPGNVGLKHGTCPAVRPVCPGTKFGGPKTCSNDGSCPGREKCCYDTCLEQHVCKTPLEFSGGFGQGSSGNIHGGSGFGHGGSGGSFGGSGFGGHSGSGTQGAGIHNVGGFARKKP